ncbi:MAG: carboxypeptidase regulatory-like domain-containing protein [Rhodospirillaceae bacterium]|nr:carboxypeptidase regulatory-like domain-containing protein [Rhodospirillaceae bacterium]
MRAGVIVLLVLAVAGLIGPGAALAHRLNLFAYVEGTSISGSAFFSGGGVPQGADVVAFGPDGAELGRTRTDAQGAFALDATVRVDHRLTVETADGHAAEFVVTAAELPAGLPAPDGSVAAGPAAMAAPEAGTAAGAPPQAAVDEAVLAAMITETVRQQVRPLREELLAYGAEVRVRDVVGGIGYILGLFGIVAYVLSRRQRPAAHGAGAPGQAAAQ